MRSLEWRRIPFPPGVASVAAVASVASVASVAAVAAVALAASPLIGVGTAHAQGVAIDEGTFLLTRDGRDVGSEAFSIRSTGAGAEQRTIATARIHWTLEGGARHVVPALEVRGPDAEVVGYQSKVSGDLSRQVTVQRSQLLVSRLESDRGESVREFRPRPGLVILDAGIIHQLYFLGLRARQGVSAVPVLVPSEEREARAQVTASGTETLRIAGTSLEATRYGVQLEGVALSLWLDSQGRVLRVENASTGIVATRGELP